VDVFYNPAFLVAAFLGVTLAGLSKGGFAGAGILATPLMALAIPPVEAAAIMLPILIIQDALSLWNYRGSIDWRNISILLPGAMIGILAGYLLAAYLSEDVTGGIIGIISTVFAARSLFSSKAADAPPTEATVPAGLFWGTLSGFASMILHAGGPPFQIYVQPQKLERDLFIGTSVLYFAVVNWIKVPPYLMLGELNADTLKVSLALAPLAIITTLVGIRIIRYFSTEMFYKIINVLLLGIGLKLLWSAAHSLLFA
jgi:uncharacterized protein